MVETLKKNYVHHMYCITNFDTRRNKSFFTNQHVKTQLSNLCARVRKGANNIEQL